MSEELTKIKRDYRVEFGTDWEYKKEGKTLAKNVKTEKTVYISENGEKSAEEVGTVGFGESPIDTGYIRVVKDELGNYYTATTVVWDGEPDNFDDYYKSLDDLQGPFTKK